MSGGDDSEEKTEPASERKLRKLREDGVVASSQIGAEYVAFAAGLVVAVLLVLPMAARLERGFDTAFAALGEDPVEQPGLLRHFLLDIHAPIALVMGVIVVSGLAFKVLVHKGFVFSLKRVAPDLSHVSPASGLKKLFKGQALTDFAMSALRFTVLAGVMAVVGWVTLPDIANMDLCVPGCAADVAWGAARAILVAVLAVILVTVGLDVMTSQAFFLIEQRMSKTEVKRERKEMLGTPEVKQARRRLQRDAFDSAGVVGLRAATAYFVSREDAVAIVFDRVRSPLPRIAAKGAGREARAEMIAAMRNRGVPGVQSAVIVDACLPRPVGDAVPSHVFGPLAASLRQMMG